MMRKGGQRSGAIGYDPALCVRRYRRSGEAVGVETGRLAGPV